MDAAAATRSKSSGSLSRSTGVKVPLFGSSPGSEFSRISIVNASFSISSRETRGRYRGTVSSSGVDCEGESLLVLVYGVEPDSIRLLLGLAVEDWESRLSGGGDEERRDPFHDFC